MYGLDQYQSLVVLPEEVAQQVLRDVERISRARTLGEARQLEPELEYLSLPLGDDDEDDAVPYDPSAFEDFPPRLGTIALDALPDELDIGEEVDCFPSNPYLYIDPADEGRLLELARSEGYSIRRDDHLIGCLDRT